MRHPLRSVPSRLAAWALAIGPSLAWGADPQAPTAGRTPTRPTAVAAQPKVEDPKTKKTEPDVIFLPTPQEVVDAMLDLAQVKKGEVLYDLGCGDGRIVCTAAKKYGARATGIDIDPERIKDSRARARDEKVEDLVTITQGDIFEADLGRANVVTLYLLPDLNVRLMPRLRQLKPGTRIVSHDFDMKGAKPKKVVTVRLGAGDDQEEHTVYLWVVPWEKDSE